MNHLYKNTNQTEHAIVIGGSIAGLLTARVLANFFANVTVIERDILPETPTFRKGAPQARHAHGLLVRGQMIMEEFFPGLTDELIVNGAIPTNMGSEAALYFGGKRLRPFVSALNPIGCSRALIEHQLYQRLRRYPQVDFLQGHVVDSICTDSAQTHVTAVRVRNRHQPQDVLKIISASLVVDASGRNSAMPQWLAQLGYTPPAEITVDAKAGYATRVYRRPAHAPDWKVMYYLAEAPAQSRGGLIIPFEANEEGERWMVTLVGLNGDHPPTDEAGFLQFARSLPVPDFYAAIANAEPLSAPYGYQRAANRLRKYDQLPRYLDGLLAIGDAVYALNPVYGQGMTVAALGAKTVQQVLGAHRRRHAVTDQSGLAKRFQRELAKVVAGPWQLATGQDLRWPVTASEHKTGFMERLVQRYFDAVIRTMADDATIAEAFFHVQNMLHSPTTLFYPKIIRRVWQHQSRPAVPYRRPVTRIKMSTK
ncbi:FAD-dependent monooxygenase [Chloroflexi bacterium TSY]|nr:FAD-dependent monooxygenase [Chloroflexi bacterium TSY]